MPCCAAAVMDRLALPDWDWNPRIPTRNGRHRLKSFATRLGMISSTSAGALPNWFAAKCRRLGGPPGRLADRLRRLNPGLSHPLAGILEQCLTVSGARQFSDAQELVHAIELQTKLQTRPLSLRTRFWTQLPDGLLLFLPAFAAVAGLFGTGILHPIGLPLLLNGLAAGLFMYPIWETLLGWTPGRRLRGLRLLDAAAAPAALASLRPLPDPPVLAISRCLFDGTSDF